jgi:hypothetical protein
MPPGKPIAFTSRRSFPRLPHAAEALAATECAQLRAELANLRAEIANLRAEVDQRRKADFEVIAKAVIDYSNDVRDQVKTLTRVRTH